MPERTTTVWTCSRCGFVEEVEGTGQPKDWVRVGFVHPPKASWTDKLTVLGDLCNNPDCGGLIVAFMGGTEEAERARQAEFARMLASLDAEEKALESVGILSPSDPSDSDETGTAS